MISSEINSDRIISNLEFIGWSSGPYKQSNGTMSGGITLQFVGIETGDPYYAVFNAITKRTRTTKHGKKGSYLGKNKFRITKLHAFYRFWKSTGLPLPMRWGKPNLSGFPDYMGKLKKFLFSGILHEDKEGRLIAGKLMVLPCNKQVENSQSTVKNHVNLPRKESSESFKNSDFDSNLSTCHDNHDKRNELIRINDNTHSKNNSTTGNVYDWSKVPLRTLEPDSKLSEDAKAYKRAKYK